MAGQRGTAARTVGAVRIRLVAAFAALVALSAFGAACSTVSGGPRGGTAPSRQPAAATGHHAIPAVVLGDSLSVQATARIEALIPGVVVDAAVGRTLVTPLLTDAGLPRIPDLADLDAAWFVVELGTNDSTFAATPIETSRSDIGTVLDTIGRERCIAWVLPYARSPRSAEAIAATNAFRDAASAAVSALACGRVLDWGKVAESNPHLLASDGVHLANPGIEKFADLIAFGVS